MMGVKGVYGEKDMDTSTKEKDIKNGEGAMVIGSKAVKEQLLMVLEDIRGLIIYRNIPALGPMKALEKLLEGLLEGLWPVPSLLGAYCEFLHELIRWESGTQDEDISWKRWVLQRVLMDENPFTLGSEEGKDLPPMVLKAVDHDLRAMYRIAHIPLDGLVNVLKKEYRGHEIFNPFKGGDYGIWDELLKSRGLSGWCLNSLMEYYRAQGAGDFSQYMGFYWDNRGFNPIENTDPITLDGLIGYEKQKNILMENTEKFLEGYPANNVLLYGDRGTGKSSMVKALIHEYGSRGLRIIELPKAHLADYHKILRSIENRNFKFILFVDDLSFEDHETEYKDIKALLEGGLKVRPANLLVYATSNRRHIVRELGSDRHSSGYGLNEREEISPTDSMQEKLSLADRFGITLTFIAPNQKGYMEIIEAMAKERDIDIERDELWDLALKWERRFNGRSGRTARQFMDHLEGTLRK